MEIGISAAIVVRTVMAGWVFLAAWRYQDRSLISLGVLILISAVFGPIAKLAGWTSLSGSGAMLVDAAALGAAALFTARAASAQRSSGNDQTSGLVELEKRVRARTEILKAANDHLRNEIAERKKTEQALRESEARLEHAQELAQMGSWEFRPEDDEAIWSAQMYRIFGLDQADWRGGFEDFIKRFVPAAGEAAFREGWKQRLERDSFAFEFLAVRTDGEERLILSNGRKEYDQTGKLLRYVGTTQDVTDQRRAEVEARKSEQWFRSSFDDSIVGIAFSSLDSDFVQVNPAFCTFCGYSAEELLTMNRTQLLDPEEHDEALKDDQRLLRGDIPTYTVERRYRHKQGHVLWAQVAASIMRDPNDRPLYFIHQVSDQSARRKAQEERRRIEAKMQQLQKTDSMGMMAGGLSHEFNNLLASIIGYSDLAREDTPANNPARKNIEQVIDSAQQAAELTSQMLAFSGKARFLAEPLDLSELVRNSARLISAVLTARIELKLELDELLPRIKGNSNQLQQAMLNLARNAAEAIGDSAGTVVMRTSEVQANRSLLASAHLDEDLPEGRYVSLEVIDSGPGMDAKTRERIFDPFYTTKFTGRGLGLAAVLGVVRGHHGSVRVDSEPGRGASVSLLFPVMEDSAVPAPAASIDASDQRKTVLVVDDDQSVRGVASTMLRRAGFTAMLAANGSEAVEVFQEHGDEILLVLLDLTMPNMSAEEAVRLIRKIRLDVPIVLSSGYSELDLAERFNQSAINGFLPKPYDSRELIAAVRGAVGARAARV